jgi:hypothetical protein
MNEWIGIRRLSVLPVLLVARLKEFALKYRRRYPPYSPIANFLSPPSLHRQLHFHSLVSPEYNDVHLVFRDVVRQP